MSTIGAEKSIATLMRALSRRLQVDLARAWRRPPNVATLNVVGMTTSIFYCIGGSAVLIVSLVCHEAVDRIGFATIGVLAIVIGAACFLGRDHLPRWLYFFAVLLGTGLITWILFLSHDRIVSMALALLYLFVVVDAAFFFSIRAALVQYATMLATALLAFKLIGIPAGATTLLVICSLAIMVVVMWLARKIDEAEEDSLTGLFNRRGVDRRLEEAMRNALNDCEPLSAAIIDLDKFKLVNDTQGHLKGDLLLVDCAHAWSKLLPRDSFLGRYGGDEFLLVSYGQNLGITMDLANQLREATPHGATASIGVAQWTPGESASMFLSRADTALLQAKSNGRNQTAVYDDSSHAKHDIEAAIANGEFDTVYQPIVHLVTRTVVAYEALLRWQHPRHGPRLPDEFIALAERSGAIHSLGLQLVEAVIADISEGLVAPVPININVSVHELRRPTYAEDIIRLLDRHCIPYDALVVEVTESAFGDEDPSILKNLYRLHEKGIQIAIDDFGAGYSSLRRIQSLSVDVIKLDGSMVQAITCQGGKMPILQALVTMGKGLGVRMVAEWVETEEQAATLQAIGYQYAQGYLFGPPAPLTCRKQVENEAAIMR